MSCRHGPAGQHLAGRFLWPSWTLWPCKVRETLKCLEMLDILLDMFLGGSSFYQVVVPKFSFIEPNFMTHAPCQTMPKSMGDRGTFTSFQKMAMSKIKTSYEFRMYPSKTVPVGGIPTPLKNMSSSVGMILPN